MENNKTEKEGCRGCSMCGFYDGSGRHHLVRMFIRILIALFVFWAGVEFGELRAAIHGNYGTYRMMGGYYGGQVNRGFYGPNMMYNVVQQKAVAQPATVSTTTKK